MKNLKIKGTIKNIIHVHENAQLVCFCFSDNIPRTHLHKQCFDFLLSRVPAPLLSHPANSFKASVASLAQSLQPHQPPVVGHEGACPLVWDSREGSRARTPRTPKHPEQLEVPSSHPASQKNNQNRENL